MDYRHLWLENGVFIYIWALLWSKSFASPVDYYPPWQNIDIREEIDRKSQALNTRIRVPQFTYLRSPINNLSHVTKNVGFM